eukprot:CAMPEP_0185175576 /NCGR_PEP_ID=MMETSP1139-20130426/27015_1 /TAXON_ID=298111 /ORGANISM="Pavlova sp., Strain CCMP459" /LENGTH=223 /DNA_ID=CAMNT_0027741313 /DNA_START=29 /DNA_END=700 /DNA_ORIENTATION=-
MWKSVLALALAARAVDAHLCAPGCHDGWPGDGYCDDACNNYHCNYDEGDCDVETSYSDWCADDCHPDWPGDGYCDSSCMTYDCNYDGGDCHSETYAPPSSAPPPASNGECPWGACPEYWINDDWCDDECNIEECYYDGGDCSASLRSEEEKRSFVTVQKKDVFKKKVKAQLTAKKAAARSTKIMMNGLAVAALVAVGAVVALSKKRSAPVASTTPGQDQVNML